MQDSFALATVFRRIEKVVTRQIVDETLLVPLRGNVDDMHHFFALNPVAAQLWNEINGVRSISSLVDGVCDNFAIDRGAAEQDAMAFFKQLVEEQLVEVC